MNMNKTRKIKRGSLKNKVIATELAEERQNIDFKFQEMGDHFIIDKEVQEMISRVRAETDDDPALAKTHKYYEWTR